jgi:hypothetical protein
LVFSDPATLLFSAKNYPRTEKHEPKRVASLRIRLCFVRSSCINVSTTTTKSARSYGWLDQESHPAGKDSRAQVGGEHQLFVKVAEAEDDYYPLHRKHALTLQMHTAHILSAHASLDQKKIALENLKEQKNKYVILFIDLNCTPLIRVGI